MQVLRKFRSCSVHVAPLETAGIFNLEMISYCGLMQHGTRGRLAWVRQGPRSGGSALLVVGFSVLVGVGSVHLASNRHLFQPLFTIVSFWQHCHVCDPCSVRNSRHSLMFNFNNFLSAQSAALCRHAVSVRLCVYPSRSYILLKRIKISSKFFHTILVFKRLTLRQ